jgi:hypothetical protein
MGPMQPIYEHFGSFGPWAHDIRIYSGNARALPILGLVWTTAVPRDLMAKCKGADGAIR